MAILPTRSSSDTNNAADINELSTEAFDKAGTSQIAALTADASPGSGGQFLYETAAGALRKVDYDNMPSGAAGGIVFYQSGTLYTGENIKYIRLPYAITLSLVKISVITAPTGASLIVDINYVAYVDDTTQPSPTTIFTTQVNRPTVVATEYSDDSGTPNVTSLAAGGFISYSIDQVGSTIAGADLMIALVPA